MGTQNYLDNYKNHSKIKDGLCPICDSTITNMLPEYEVEKDSFDYICNKCAGEKIISLGGSFLGTSHFEKLIGESKYKTIAKRIIENCDKNVINLGYSDFVNIEG
jgi:hypothetical protein